MNLENLNSHRLNRVMNTTPYQGERKVKEQKICEEGGYSWACKREVTVSIKQCMKSTFFFLTIQKERPYEQLEIKNVKQIHLQEYDPTCCPKEQTAYCLKNLSSKRGQPVNSEAGASSGVSVSRSVVLCWHCITNSVSAQFPLRIWDSESFRLQNIIFEGIT